MGFPPGGSADTIARLLAERLPVQLGGQATVVDNKPSVVGRIGYNVDVISEALEQHRAGKVRIIAVAGARRSPMVPEVPTLRKQGVAMDASAWFAMYGPGTLPAAATMKNPGLLAKWAKPVKVSGFQAD